MKPTIMNADPKELRVGNIVDYFNEASDRWLNSRELSNNDMLCLLDGRADHADAIPLTEEWLKRIDWKGYIYLHINSNFSLDEYGHLYYRNDYTGVNVQYVHQLQNLYFALTGEELTLRES